MISLLFSACTGEAPSQISTPEAPLVVCVQEGNLDYYSNVLREFKKLHPEANYTFQTIPSAWMQTDENFTDNPEKKALFDTLRTEIMSGAGPDLFLLPATNTGLFPDLEKTMRAGVFYDLRPLLEKALEGRNLQPQVMESGMVGDARYIVPLSLELSLLLTTPELFAGCTAGIEDSPTEFLEKLEAHFGIKPLRNFSFVEFHLDSLCAPPFLDYETHTVRTDEEFISLAESCTDAMLHRTYDFENFPSPACPLRIATTGTGSYELEAWTVDVWEKGELPFVMPFPNGASGTTASVGLYAAVRSNSKHVSQAAEIIEFLLSPEIQAAYMGFTPCLMAVPVDLNAVAAVYSDWAEREAGNLTETQSNALPDFLDQLAACVKAVNRACLGNRANLFLNEYLLRPVASRGVSMEEAVADLQTAMRFYFEE